MDISDNRRANNQIPTVFGLQTKYGRADILQARILQLSIQEPTENFGS